MPQFPYATSLLAYFVMGIVPHIDELHSMDQQGLLLMCVSGGCLVSRMLIYGVLLAENKHQKKISSKRLLLVCHTQQKKGKRRINI